MQIRFFKLRQSEFEPYKFLVDPLQVPIGNLASPLYFDFIAFSQYATLSKAIPDAPQVFQARTPPPAPPAHHSRKPPTISARAPRRFRRRMCGCCAILRCTGCTCARRTGSSLRLRP